MEKHFYLCRKNIFIFLNHEYFKDTALISNSGCCGILHQAHGIFIFDRSYLTG